jgi:uncharacterized repeat protein (TIGR04138 family)
MTAAEKFRKLLQSDGRYDAEAYNFVYEALDFTLKSVARETRTSQHVTGRELLEGIRRYAIEQFGCMTRTVFACWGIHATADVGEIVFNLVEHDLMGRQDSDSKADFADVYGFDDVFDLSPVFSYVPDRKEWKTAYVARAHQGR